MSTATKEGGGPATSAESQQSVPNGNTGQGDYNFSFLYDLTTAPCFRQSTLLGIGGGGAIGALNFLRNKDPMRGAEMMVKSGCGVALLSWIACRKKYYDEREATYGAMEDLKKVQAMQAAQRAKQMREEGKRDDR